MKVSREARHYAKELYKISFKAGVLDPERVHSIVDFLLEHPPRHLLEILKSFLRLIRLELAKHTALIQTAAPLSQELHIKLAALLKKRDEQLILTQEVVPSLIGGARIRLGSDVWDASIKSRLTDLENHF